MKDYPKINVDNPEDVKTLLRYILKERGNDVKDYQNLKNGISGGTVTQRDALVILRNGTAAEWTAENPILSMAELCFENDTNKIKCGDGVTAWNALAYI